MKKELSSEQLFVLRSVSSQAREAWLAGRVEEAEIFLMKAWAIFPEQPKEYDYAQSISRGIVIFYRDTKQFSKAIEWLEVMRDTYASPQEPSVEFLSGRVQYLAGDSDKAFSIYDSLFQKFKKRSFEGEKPEYWAFYKNEVEFRRQKK